VSSESPQGARRAGDDIAERVRTGEGFTLAELIALRATSSPDAVYIEDARSDRRLNYSALAQAIDLWHDEFRAWGVPAGGSIIVDLDDPLSFAVVHLAVVAAGLQSIPVDPDSSAKALRTLSGLLGGVSLIVSDRRDRTQLPDAPSLSIDAASWRPSRVSEPREPAGSAGWARPGDGSAILFTSGSTGSPKGVQLPEAQLVFVASAVARHNALSPDDRGYNPLPLFHVNAQVVGLLATLVSGATLVLDRRFHRTGFWQLIDEREVTWLNAVPAILAVLARSGEMPIPDRLRFIRSASAPLPDAVREALGGIPLVVSYGMTEAASQITATPLGESAHDGSVGVPVGAQIEVRTEDGSSVETGEVGALWVRGPGVIVRYYDDRAADRFDQVGWLKTGDLGRIDDDGYVYLVGRSDDVINRGGEKVYPAEVEDVLLTDDRVREAVVIARADDVLGSVPVAFVILHDPAASGLESELVDALALACKDHLPRFKRPVEITVVTDVPRAPTGKVQRSRMRAALEDDTQAAS
jgi:acyl-CoA synthetase (AMP-forming)/AMP-acid ligase II